MKFGSIINSNEKNSRCRFAQWAVLAYMLVVLLILTLSPFRFTWPANWVVSITSDVRDMPANFLLFLPLGYFLLAAMQPRGNLVLVVIAGFCISLSIETAQMFLSQRLTSLSDLASNTMGAGTGAWIGHILRDRLTRKMPGVLTLNLPVFNVLYLLLPLMWIVSAGALHKPGHLWLILPLGSMGALVIIGLWRYRFQRALGWSRMIILLFVASWFLFGSIWGLAAAPATLVLSCIGVLAIAIVFLFLPRRFMPEDRRFEYRILFLVWPVYLVYLLVSALGVQPWHFVPFDFTWGYPQYGFERPFTLRIAEHLVALTLLSYLISESIGRLVQRSQRRMLIATFTGLLVVILLELLHGTLPGDRASFARGVIGGIAVLSGALLFSAQLNLIHVVRLRV